jgi:tetratricopeptide (TPR) repeat protein
MTRDVNASVPPWANRLIGLRGTLAIMLFVCTFALFSPSLRYGLVGLDDHDYIAANPLFVDGLTLKNVRTVFTSVQHAMYAPVLWLSLLIDAHFLDASSGDPRGFHMVNVVLHALNAVLLYLLLLACCRKPWRAFFFAALWAFHPLRVESVAWITARKEVLTGLFGLLCVGAYLLAFRRPRASFNRPSIPLYTVSLLFLILGLLVKPALALIAAALLLMDYWPLQRVELSWRPLLHAAPRLIAEKIPFILVAALAIFGAFHSHMERHALADLPMLDRLLSIPIHYLFYLSKSLIPQNLSPLYADLPVWIPSALLAILIFVAISVWAWRSRQVHPHVLVGWLFFLIMFLPVIGLARFGIQSIADRFTYVPAMGLSLLLLYAWPPRRTSLVRTRLLRVAVALAVLALLAAGTLRLLPTWRSSTTLFTRVLSVNPDNRTGLHLRSLWLIHEDGNFEDAREGFARIIDSGVFDQEVLNGMARCLAELKGPSEARDFLLQSPATTNPYDIVARSWDIARYSLMIGQHEAAIQHAREALRYFPRDHHSRPEYLHLLIMTAAHENGDRSLALAHARQFPAYADKTSLAFHDLLPYYLHQWMVFHRTDAHAFFRRLIEAYPDNIGLINNIAWGLATANWSPADPSEVVAHAQAVSLALPDHPGTLDTLAAAQANAGDYVAAAQSIARAIKLLPDSDDPRMELFRSRLHTRLDLYQRGQPYREEGFGRLMAAQFGQGLPIVTPRGEP